MVDSLCNEGVCKIKSLNLAGNNAVPFEYRGPQGQFIERFSDRMSKLLKSSLSLQHLDLSLLNLEHSQIKTIFHCGVKKAKSLLSLHLSGNRLLIESLIYIRD